MSSEQRHSSSSSEEDGAVGSLTSRFSELNEPISHGACGGPNLDSRRKRHPWKANEEDGPLFDVREYPEDKRSKLLEVFFETNPPSKLKQSDGIGWWIRVCSPSFENETLDFKGLKADWEQLQKSGETIDFDAVTKLAKSYGYLGGKWLIFLSNGDLVDTEWEKIATATAKDELGTLARVTLCADVEQQGSALEKADYIIGVFITDFTDKDDVMRVEGILRAMGIRGHMNFKPNVWRPLGVYTDNTWNLRLSIYTSKWDADKGLGSIRYYSDAWKASRKDGLLFDPREYPEEEHSKRLEAFFETSAPSKLKRSDRIGWIRVRSPSFENKTLDFEGLQADWEQLQESGETIDFDAVTKLAKSYGFFGGNWLIFFYIGDLFDTDWKKIATATAKGELGTHAKVTLCADVAKLGSSAERSIGVSIKDFTDKKDAMRVEGILRAMGIRSVMKFQPNVYGRLGVNSNNKWNLRPSIYSSYWNVDKGFGSIRDYSKAIETVFTNYK